MDENTKDAYITELKTENEALKNQLSYYEEQLNNLTYSNSELIKNIEFYRGQIEAYKHCIET